MKHCTRVHTWQQAHVNDNEAESCLKSLQKVEQCCIFRNGFATCLATFPAIARYATLCNVLYDLSRNGITRQVARKIAQCDSAIRQI